MRTEHERTSLRIMVLALGAVVLFVCGGAAASIRTANRQEGTSHGLIDQRIAVIAEAPLQGVLGVQTEAPDFSWQGRMVREQLFLLEQGAFSSSAD